MGLCAGEEKPGDMKLWKVESNTLQRIISLNVLNQDYFKGKSYMESPNLIHTKAELLYLDPSRGRAGFTLHIRVPNHFILPKICFPGKRDSFWTCFIIDPMML